jgi:hypothetical protein
VVARGEALGADWFVSAISAMVSLAGGSLVFDAHADVCMSKTRAEDETKMRERFMETFLDRKGYSTIRRVLEATDRRKFPDAALSKETPSTLAEQTIFCSLEMAFRKRRCVGAGGEHTWRAVHVSIATVVRRFREDQRGFSAAAEAK